MNDSMSAQTDETADQIGEHMILDIRHLTAPQLAQLGVSQIAYVKPVVVQRRAGVRDPCRGRHADGGRRRTRRRDGRDPAARDGACAGALTGPGGPSRPS